MKKPQTITDTELAVLKMMWESEPRTAREIVERLYPAGTSSDVGTVHSMLQRLERKEMIAADRSGRPHKFSAIVSREDVAGSELESLADRLSDGSLLPFLTHLGSRGLNEDELKQLRSLVNQHRNQSKGRKK